MLKNLKLTHNVLNEENLIGFLPTFKNLQVLDLAWTSAGDNCMWALGTHCKYLRCVINKFNILITIFNYFQFEF
jgi:hypothetical protein